MATVTEEKQQQEQQHRELLERGRLEKRESIKREIAEAALAEQRHGELSAAIDQVGVDKERVGAEHVSKCEPIQRELVEIQRRLVDAVIEKKPASEKLTARRKELEEQIRANNVALETALAELDRTLGELARARREAGLASNSCVLRNELIRFARPDLLLRMRLANDRCQAVENRRYGIEERRGRIPAAYYDALLAEVQEEARRAKETADAAYKAVIDE
jgi:hypothetical protein